MIIEIRFVIEKYSFFTYLQYPSEAEYELDQAKTALDSILNSNWQNFLNYTFPGLNGQNTTNLEHLSRLIILFNQKKPDAFIKSSQCALEAKTNIQSSNPLDFWLNPSNESAINFLDFKVGIQTQIQDLDTVKSFKSLMSALWYSRLPCFDVQNVTGKNDEEKSILKNCQWKGLPISCAAIFKTLPTDHGMCCIFNMDEAETIFKDSEYTRFVIEQNIRDKNNSFQNVTPPDWYTAQGAFHNNIFYDSNRKQSCI